MSGGGSARRARQKARKAKELSRQETIGKSPSAPASEATGPAEALHGVDRKLEPATRWLIDNWDKIEGDRAAVVRQRFGLGLDQSLRVLTWVKAIREGR